MRKIFTFLLSVLLVSSLSAQKKEAYINLASEIPVIGGDIDAVWEQADEVSIELPYYAGGGPETPTLGDPGDTYWKGLWDDNGVYILVYVADDYYKPWYDRVDQADVDNPWTYDVVELFFDVNQIKEDGQGGKTNPNVGHYQLAPAHGDAKASGYDDGVKHTYTNGAFTYDYSINAVGSPNYFYEFFIPWSSFKDKDGAPGDAEQGFGFEVAIADNDSGLKDDRNRMVWSNNAGGADDSWSNMDKAGLLFFDGYVSNPINEIILTGSDITKNGETLTIGVELIAEDETRPLTDSRYLWYIVEEETTASYRFDKTTGTLTPLTNGTFTVYAESTDTYATSDNLTINITGQVLTLEKANLIVDGYNQNPQVQEGKDDRPNAEWSNTTWNGYGEHTAFVVDGIFYFNSDSLLQNTHNMKIVQSLKGDITIDQKEVEYVARWRMWADAVDTIPLVTEDQPSWGRWAVSLPNHSANVNTTDDPGIWDVILGTEPQWYYVHFTPGNIGEDSTPWFGWQVGHLGTNTVYLDSMYLISVADSALIDWDYTAVDKNPLTQETLNVYPNPATNVLNVSLSTPNSKVAIYNSVGIKVDETVVDGSTHTFDVSGYSPGLYFVRTDNAVAKFIK